MPPKKPVPVGGNKKADQKKKEKIIEVDGGELYSTKDSGPAIETSSVLRS